MATCVCSCILSYTTLERICAHALCCKKVVSFHQHVQAFSPHYTQQSRLRRPRDLQKWLPTRIVSQSGACTVCRRKGVVVAS